MEKVDVRKKGVGRFGVYSNFSCCYIYVLGKGFVVREEVDFGRG